MVGLLPQPVPFWCLQYLTCNNLGFWYSAENLTDMSRRSYLAAFFAGSESLKDSPLFIRNRDATYDIALHSTDICYFLLTREYKMNHSPKFYNIQ